MKKSNKKIKKIIPKKEKTVKKGKEEETKKIEGEEEEVEKDSGTISDGVLDAFEEVVPVDPLLEVEDDTILPEDEEDDDELDLGDYRPSDDW